MIVQCKLSTQDVLDIVAKELTNRGIQWSTLKPTVYTDTYDHTEFDGMTFEVHFPEKVDKKG